jgi:hypothetical protein
LGFNSVPWRSNHPTSSKEYGSLRGEAPILSTPILRFHHDHQEWGRRTILFIVNVVGFNRPP